ncbi:hypothetical protein H311_00782 [Anncaliia algerae PRA109]|nr:hypothetical protein H311_00782 [Anncaliia algerae PRA109]
MGRVPQDSIWVFGIIDTSKISKRYYVRVVADISADTLLPIIARIVRPGSTIHTDESRFYKDLAANGNNQKTINHSLHFVNPVNGVHMQRIEFLWSQLKYKINMMKSVRRYELSLYLKEFM